PPLVVRVGLPLGNDNEWAVVDRSQEPAAAESTALARVLEDLERTKSQRELVGSTIAREEAEHRDDCHVVLRRAHASSETAAARMTPLITYCSSGVVPSKLKPLPIICRKKAPRTVRQMAPSPPRSDVPPRTMAVIASNSIPVFAFHWAVWTSE